MVVGVAADVRAQVLAEIPDPRGAAQRAYDRAFVERRWEEVPRAADTPDHSCRARKWCSESSARRANSLRNQRKYWQRSRRG